MRWQVERSIRRFDARAWDAAAGSRLMTSHCWLRCMEETQKRSQPFYALISDGKGPLAALAAPYMKTVEPLRILSGPWTAGALARLTLLATVPFYGGAGGFSLRSGVDLGQALPALEPVFKAVCLKARRLVLAIGNVAESDLPSWDALGFQHHELPPGCALRLAEGYSDYLKLLTGRDRRELARMRRVAERAGTTFEQRPRLDNDAELYQLLCERYAHHGVSQDNIDLAPSLFRCLERDFPDRIVLFQAKAFGRRAGYMLGLRRGDELYLLFSGYRYELSRPRFVYFLLYDEAVRWSLANGVSVIDAGTTLLAEKARQGFSPVRRWVCWRAASRPVQAALGVLDRPLRALWPALRRET